MRLSIIIINYKSGQLIINCINSILQYQSTSLYEIIVVDNDSGDNSEALLKHNFPFIKWVQMGYNAGFARANNAGIKTAIAPIVLLLNPDTLAFDNSIEICLRHFTASTYAACGVQLLNEDKTPQIAGNFAMKGGLNYLLPLPYVGAILKFIAGAFSVKKPNVPNAVSTVEVDWINGAFLMAKKNSIDKAGLLDEDFFLYAEEAEWCSRIKKTGKLCIYGQCHILHLQGEISNNTFNSQGKGYFNIYDKKGLQIMLSNFVRIRKEFGAAWFLGNLIIYSLTIPVFLIAGFIHCLFGSRNFAGYCKQWTGFTKNVFHVWKLSIIILYNKPYFYKVL